MIFLFVGSSGLTEASYPRNLAIPQLLRSSACAKLRTMKANRLAVFPHRGLSPRQLTPMSGAHKATAPNAAMTLLFQIEFDWRGIGESRRSAKGTAQTHRQYDDEIQSTLH